MASQACRNRNIKLQNRYLVDIIQVKVSLNVIGILKLPYTNCQMFYLKY
jgi:hypothetical protein